MSKPGPNIEAARTYEDTGTAFSIRALSPQALNLAVGVDLVVLKDGHLDLLALVLDALGGVVSLLLPLLGTTAKTQHKVKGRLLLNVVVGKSAAILELLAGEDQALLVRRDAACPGQRETLSEATNHSPLLVLDLGLDIINSI